jgi:hypothetical protein
MVTSRGVQILQNYRSHLKISGARNVTRSKFPTENPQILDVMAAWLPGFGNPWLRVQIIDLSLCTILEPPISSYLLVQTFPLPPLCPNTVRLISVLVLSLTRCSIVSWAWAHNSHKTHFFMSLYCVLHNHLFHPPVFFTLYCTSEMVFLLWPRNAQLSHKLSHYYMFRHYRVILRELVINTLPSYTSISNAAVGNTVYNQDVSRRLCAISHTTVFEISILWNH